MSPLQAAHPQTLQMHACSKTAPVRDRRRVQLTYSICWPATRTRSRRSSKNSSEEAFAPSARCRHIFLCLGTWIAPQPREVGCQYEQLRSLGVGDEFGGGARCFLQVS